MARSLSTLGQNQEYLSKAATSTITDIQVSSQIYEYEIGKIETARAQRGEAASC